MKRRFLCIHAYQVAARYSFDYISLYLLWYIVFALISTAMFVGLGLYLHILNPDIFQNSFALFSALIKKWFIEIDLNVRWRELSDVVTPFGFFKKFLAESMIHENLHFLSWTEYFRMVILPKKTILLSVICVYFYIWQYFRLATLQTALRLQSNKPISWYHGYQPVGLVARYAWGKMLISGMVILLMSISILAGYYWFAKAVYLVGFVSMIGAIFLYQRIRFLTCFIVDRNNSFMQACTASWRVTKGNVMQLCLESLVSTGIGLIIFGRAKGIFLYGSIVFKAHTEVNMYYQLLEISEQQNQSL